MPKRKTFKNWRKQFKLSTSNIDTFNETWSITTSKVRLVSLTILILLIVGIGVALLFLNTPLRAYFGGESHIIDRSQVIAMHQKVKQLESKIGAQEKYIANFNAILNGEIIEDTLSYSPIQQAPKIDPDSILSQPTKEEEQLREKVKEEGQSNSTEDLSNFTFLDFAQPVKGVVSQQYNKNHPGVDVAAVKRAPILSTLRGTVIYSSYTQKDGHVLIVQHRYGFLSVYKHAEKRLKKVGEFIQKGDKIGIVGSSGENSNGPHLHFELWLNQSPVNPEDCISFTK